jgi:hypothetical protein
MVNITDNGTFPTTAQTGTSDAFFPTQPGRTNLVEIYGATFDSGSIEVEVRVDGTWQTLATKGAITEAEGFQFVSRGTAIRFVVTSVAAAGADIDIYVMPVS